MRFLGCHLYNCFSYFFNRENEASLAVLPDLLMELDCMNEVCILWNSFPLKIKSLAMMCHPHLSMPEFCFAWKIDVWYKSANTRLFMEVARYLYQL